MLLAIFGIGAAAFALLYPVTLAAFCLAVYCRDRYESSEGLRQLIWAALFFCSALALIVLDVLFNASWGSVIFRELPQWTKHEWLFTGRVQRHYRAAHAELDYGRPYTWQYRPAFAWAELLNNIDPGHVTLAD